MLVWEVLPSVLANCLLHSLLELNLCHSDSCLSFSFYWENGLNPGVAYLDWKRSSGWLESWEGLLLANDVSTTCTEAIFKVKSQETEDGFPPRVSKCQSLTVVLLRTPITLMGFSIKVSFNCWWISEPVRVLTIVLEIVCLQYRRWNLNGNVITSMGNARPCSMHNFIFGGKPLDILGFLVFSLSHTI